MRLSSQSSQFIFNLPLDFVPLEIQARYNGLLEKNWVQYENVIDYLNSSIKSVNFPGIGMDLIKQRIEQHGKSRSFRPATNINDLASTRELTVTFESIDSDLNYFILMDIFTNHYLDIPEFLPPLKIDVLDIHRDLVYSIIFTEVHMTRVSDNTFNYSSQKVENKSFTVNFHFNFWTIDNNYDNSKVLEMGKLPTIIVRK